MPRVQYVYSPLTIFACFEDGARMPIILWACGPRHEAYDVQIGLYASDQPGDTCLKSVEAISSHGRFLYYDVVIDE